MRRRKLSDSLPSENEILEEDGEEQPASPSKKLGTVQFQETFEDDDMEAEESDYYGMLELFLFMCSKTIYANTESVVQNCTLLMTGFMRPALCFSLFFFLY